MFHTSWHTVPHDLWHTCPCRHLNVQSSEDTCEDVFEEQKHKEFELVQPLRIALTIGDDTLCLSIITVKTTVVQGGMVLPVRLPVVFHLYRHASFRILATFMKLLLRPVQHPVFCLRHSCLRSKIWTSNKQVFLVTNSKHDVTCDKRFFLWYRLFCTMWQFVTRSRYKNKVHVWVFLKNKSGYVSHYSLDLSQDSSHMLHVVSHTRRGTVNTVNITVDLRRRTRKSSRESVALTYLSSPDPPSYSLSDILLLPSQSLHSSPL